MSGVPKPRVEIAPPPISEEFGARQVSAEATGRLHYHVAEINRALRIYGMGKCLTVDREGYVRIKDEEEE